MKIQKDYLYQTYTEKQFLECKHKLEESGLSMGRIFGQPTQKEIIRDALFMLKKNAGPIIIGQHDNHTNLYVVVRYHGSDFIKRVKTKYWISIVDYKLDREVISTPLLDKKMLPNI